MTVQYKWGQVIGKWSGHNDLYRSKEWGFSVNTTGAILVYFAHDKVKVITGNSTLPDSYWSLAEVRRFEALAGI